MAPYLWMLVSALMFALMAVLTESLRGSFHWLMIAFVRSALAAGFAVVLIVGAGAQYVIFKPASLWMRSLAGCAAMLLGFYAMTHMEVAIVSTLTNMYPLWVAILSWPLLGEFPRRDTWVAAVVSIAGVCLLSLGPHSHAAAKPQRADAAETVATTGTVALNSSESREVAVVAAIAAAFFSGIALIGLHRLKGLDSRAVVAHFSGVSAILCGVACAFTYGLGEQQWKPEVWSDGSLWRLLAVGFCATLGQLFLTKAFSMAPADRISVVGLSQIGFVLLLGWGAYQWLDYGRPPVWNWQTLAGMLLIVGSTAWVMLRRNLRP